MKPLQAFLVGVLLLPAIAQANTVSGGNYAALFDNLQIPPMFLLIGGLVLGFFVARKFPGILPKLFAPDTELADLKKQLADIQSKLAK